jgi:hypothetical protein
VGSRYAKPIKIEQLKDKLDLLFESGRVHMSGRVDGYAALGRLFKSQNKPKGITGKAVQLWVDGDGIRDPSMIPADRLGRLVEIFQRRLPGKRSVEETQALLLSPNVNDLATAFRASVPKVDWISLLLKAQLGGIVILLSADRDGFMVTARGTILAGLKGSVKCPVGQYFRFKLETISPGWITALQWGQSGWFGLELGDDLVALEQSQHGGMFPVWPPYYIENEPGIRRYMFINTSVPLPPDLLAKVKTSALLSVPLDVSTLDRFAHVAGEMRSDFRMNALDVHFIERKAVRGKKSKSSRK